MIRSGISLTKCTPRTLKVPTCDRRLFAYSHPLLATRPRRSSEEPKDKWNYNADPFDGRVDDDQLQLPLVDANKLERETQPPVGVKMLVRDFIEDSLYNPNYGYFPKQATIFNAEDTVFDFLNIRDSAEFQEEVAAKYSSYGADRHDGPGQQLWHTPTELFKACSIALSQYPWTNSSPSHGTVVPLDDVLSRNICSSISHMKTL